MLFYTYVWRDATGTPFYVGKGGLDCGKRAKKIISRSNEFKAIQEQGGCSVEIVDEFILESQAFAHESALIERYGRREFGGILVNKTDGGEGPVGAIRSAETRAKMSKSALNMTDDHRAKNSAGQRGKVRSAEVRLQNSTIRRASAPSAANSSGYKGVSFFIRKRKWRAAVWVNGKNKHLGWFNTPEAAALAYDEAALHAFGNDCYLNFNDRVAADGNSKLAEVA